jgi:AraC-like DNA-binding protein
MVDPGQLPAVEASARRGIPGLVTLRLSDLRDRMTGDALRRPQAGSHHLVMLVTVGHGRHMIDFMEYACRPGTLLWARPGQVHQFGTEPGLDATLLLFAPELLPPLPAVADLLEDPFGPVCWLPAGEDEEAIITEVSQLATDCTRYPDGDVLGRDLLRHQLAVLATRVATLSSGAGWQPGREVMTRFRREVAVSFATTRRVEDYAERLGYSVRTLTRACLAATGRSAKQVVDARVALEAKRMLACTDLSVAEIGRRLGFSEATNFGRFFARETGQTPGAFRELHVPAGQTPDSGGSAGMATGGPVSQRPLRPMIG